MDRLTGTVQPYAWGTTDFIPELLGTEPTGEPQAELWLGAHPSAVSTLGDRRLDELVGADPERMVGSAAVAQFGPMLPYLLKVLSAAKPLSLQAHPDRAQAEEGFAQEEEAGVPRDSPERTYKDDWPKPEAMCLLSEAELLCGFREPSESYGLFAELGVPGALELVEPLRDGGAAELKEVFAQILKLDQSQRHVVARVAEAARGRSGDGELGLFLQTAVTLGDAHPDDPGVLAALLMNRVRLERYQAVFLPAGNLHAYLHGNGVEIMANSDNVLRGGLTAKSINVAELLKVLDFTPGFPGVVPCVEEPAGVWSYRTPAPEFALWRLEVSGEALRVPRAGTGRVLLVTEGAVTARTSTATLSLDRGQSAFLTAEDDAELEGRGVVFVAGPGIG